MTIVPGTIGDDILNGTAGDDTINPLSNDGYDRINGSGGNDFIDFAGSNNNSYYELFYGGLAGPIIANLNLQTDTGSITKTGLGTDTFSGMGPATDFNAGTGDGVGIFGTAVGDMFNVTARENGYFQITGAEGADTYNINFDGFSTVRLTFTYGANGDPTQGASVDLRTQSILNDGFGNVETLTIIGDPGRISLEGTNNSDSLLGSSFEDRFRPRDGNDVIDGFGGFDRLEYTSGQITDLVVDMVAGTANGLWNGNAFADTFTDIERVDGSGNDDTISGDTLDNYLRGRRGDDSLDGNNGNDTLIGEDGADTIDGSQDDDYVEGGDGDDSLMGGPGNDTINDGPGVDFIDGGSGIDLFQRDYGGFFNFVPVIDLIENRIYAQGDPTTSFETILGIENVRVQGSQHHVVIGGGESNQLEAGPGDDSLSGNNGDDTLRGNNGDDTLRGGNGRDFLQGGEGDDLLDASGGDAASQGWGDNISPGLGMNTILGHAGLWAADEGIDLFYGNLTGVGGLTVSADSDGAGTVTSGDARVNDTFTFTHYFTGSQDDDTFIGSDADRFEGFQGRAGNDSFDGRGGYNKVDYNGEQFDHTVVNGIVANLAAGTVVDTFGHTDTLTNIDAIRGSIADDRIDARGSATPWNIEGDVGNDIIRGSASGDHLQGNDGNDFITGGGNYDRLEGGNGFDVLMAQTTGLYFTDVSAIVYRLYKATLGREPDVVGHQGWMQNLLTGTDLRDAVTLFMNSTEFQNTYGSTTDTQFVSLLYENVFGRTPSDAERDAWVDNLARPGWDRERLVEFFGESAEHKILTGAAQQAFDTLHDPTEWVDDVYRLFRAVFDREPDASGFVGWIDNLSSGQFTFDRVVTQFMASPEFQNTYGSTTNEEFVTLLYQNVLKRAPDQAGLDGWSGNLDAGMTRETVVQLFMASPEFVTGTAADLKDFVINLYGLDDILAAGPGDGILSGGIARDEFHFTNDGQASRVDVTDLEVFDLLNFSEFGLTQQEALDAMSQDGNDVVFNDNNETVVFRNTDISEITADMILV